MSKIIYAFIGILASIQTCTAQQGNVAAGGEASGSGGEVSLSVAQVFYIQNTSAEHFSIAGLQQPFEISIISGIEQEFLGLEISVYPNPTSGSVSVVCSPLLESDCCIELINVAGEIVLTRRITTPKTELALDHLPAGLYMVRIQGGNAKIETHKIIKK